MEAMAKEGLQASLSDAAVGAMCALTAVKGAYLNVKINCSGFDDAEFVANALYEAEAILAKAEAREAKIMEEVLAKI